MLKGIRDEQARTFPPRGAAATPAYSQVVVASGTRTIYVAGQISVDETGALVGAGDLGVKTTQVMRNPGAALAAAGATFADRVKVITYVVDYRTEHRAVIAKGERRLLRNMIPPASTLVGVSALAVPEWLIEIAGVAVID